MTSPLVLVLITLNYGASLFEVYHKKKKINLILNLGSKQNYRYKHPSVGSTCGRYAGRISNAKFKIGNKKFNLFSFSCDKLQKDWRRN